MNFPKRIAFEQLSDEKEELLSSLTLFLTPTRRECETDQEVDVECDGNALFQLEDTIIATLNKPLLDSTNF